jgi:hypothetical protein
MPVVYRRGEKKPQNRDVETTEENPYAPSKGTALFENLLVRIGIGAMTGFLGIFCGLEILRIVGRTTARMGSSGYLSTAYGILGACGLAGFLVGFIAADNLPDDWFERFFGGGGN